MYAQLWRCVFYLAACPFTPFGGVIQTCTLLAGVRRWAHATSSWRGK